MKLKVRLKLEEGGPEIQVRRIFIGETVEPDKNAPPVLKENFIWVRGRHLVLERHQAISRALEDEELQLFVIPLSRIDWITVLPEHIDLKKLKYRIAGERIICTTTGEEITLKERGESGV